MPYKIVKTIENGTYMLSTVPEAWESDGVLYWPLTSSVLNKLRKKDDSVPEINWKKISCIVKKSGISSYSEARFIEKELSEFTSSETEQNFDINSNHRNKRVYSGTTNEIKQLQNFDHMFAEPEVTVTSPSRNKVSSYEQVMESVVNEVGEFNMNSSLPEHVEEGIIDISVMLQQVNNIEQRLSSLEKNVQHSNAEINVKLDKILCLLEKQDNHKINVTNSQIDVLKSLPFPLTELEQIYELESKLGDPEFKTKMITDLQRIHGTGGKLDGKKVAYRLTDWLFQRRLLTQFSWTGCSKNKNKYSFLPFKGILDVFFQVVNTADISFTCNHVEQFFKINILKYSSSRAEQVESPKLKKKKLRVDPVRLNDVLNNNINVTANNGEENENNLPSLSK